MENFETETLNKQQKEFEQRQKKVRKVCIILRCIGIPILLVGLALEIYGYITFINSVHGNGEPENMWAIFAGGVLLIPGLFLTFISFSRNIIKFNKDIAIPTIKETYQDITPDITTMVNSMNQSNTATCPHCHGVNDKDAKFCKHCGKPLNEKVECPNCHQQVDDDSTYCPKCGKPLEENND